VFYAADVFLFSYTGDRGNLLKGSFVFGLICVISLLLGEVLQRVRTHRSRPKGE
jgi:hypothetical protein